MASIAPATSLVARGMPVSYTHLDVYKRQEWSEALKDLLKEASEVINPKAVAWWFNTPNALLSDLRPLDLLGSPAGYKKVKNLLFAMRWGLPV